MGSSTIITRLKSEYNKYYTKDGDMRISIKDENSYVTDIVRRLIKVVIESQDIRECTKIYITNEWITIKETAEKMTEKYSKEYKSSTINSAIYYDKLKIEAVLGSNFYEKLIDKCCDEASFKEFDSLISKLQFEIGRKAEYIKNSLLICIDTDITEKDIGEDDLKKLMNIIKVYNRRRIREVESKMSEKMLGYLNHLLYGDNLSDTDIKRLTEINYILKGV